MLDSCDLFCCAALWPCIDGYSGADDALKGADDTRPPFDLKCGGFASQQEIQAYCKGEPTCRGYSYLANMGWWCAKTNMMPSYAEPRGKWCSAPGNTQSLVPCLPCVLSPSLPRFLPSLPPVLLLSASVTRSGCMHAPMLLAELNRPVCTQPIFSKLSAAYGLSQPCGW